MHERGFSFSLIGQDMRTPRHSPSLHVTHTSAMCARTCVHTHVCVGVTLQAILTGPLKPSVLCEHFFLQVGPHVT